MVGAVHESPVQDRSLGRRQAEGLRTGAVVRAAISRFGQLTYGRLRRWFLQINAADARVSGTGTTPWPLQG